MIVTGHLITDRPFSIQLSAADMRNVKQSSDESGSLSGKTSLFLSERETDLPRVNQLIQ
jgi:hypothetical protein